MTPNYVRPAFDMKAAEKLQKPERRQFAKNRDKVKKKRTRSQVKEIVYAREKMRCQRCGRRVKRLRECTSEADLAMAHVNELVPRSKGGDPLDPDQCELVCQGCHMPGGQHAPTPERMRKLKAAAQRKE